MGSWPGYFISMEGIDGVGKSTQVAALGAALRLGGWEVVTLREPGDTQLGDLVRGYVLQHHVDGSTDPWAEALLFIAARIQLLRQVALPALERGAVVVADRYADSNLAYQGGGRGLSVDRLRRLHREACDDVWPDLTILLDVATGVARGRRRAQELPLDAIEGAPQDFHAAVHRTFLDLAEGDPGRFVKIDADRPAVAVSHDVIRVAKDRLTAARY